MSGETFLDLLIAVMVVGSILGATHTGRLRSWRKRHVHHAGAAKLIP